MPDMLNGPDGSEAPNEDAREDRGAASWCAGLADALEGGPPQVLNAAAIPLLRRAANALARPDETKALRVETGRLERALAEAKAASTPPALSNVEVTLQVYRQVKQGLLDALHRTKTLREDLKQAEDDELEARLLFVEARRAFHAAVEAEAADA